MLRIFLCAATLAASLAGSAAYGQIVLFQEDNFRGNQLPLDGGTPQLNPLHFNDWVSSVRVISGSWMLCDDDFFRGRCVTVSHDESKLDRLGMDDRISSVGPADRRMDRRRFRDERRNDRDRDWDRRR